MLGNYLNAIPIVSAADNKKQVLKAAKAFKAQL